MGLPLQLVVKYHINCFSHVQLALWTWDKFHLVVHDSFYILFYSIGQFDEACTSVFLRKCHPPSLWLSEALRVVANPGQVLLTLKKADPRVLSR